MAKLRLLSAGPLRVRASGGSDGAGGGNGPAIVLSHGFGAPGDDLVSLADATDVGDVPVRWFFPEAPIALDLGMSPGPRAWWELDMARVQRAMMDGTRMKMIEETPEGLAEARAALEECLAALELDPARTILGGFSQGAMLSTEIALHRDVPFAGLAILSGSLLSVDRWGPAIDARAKSLRVFQSHGQRDPIIPFEAGAALRNLLQAHGAELDFVTFQGGHEIPRPVLQRFGAFARAVLAPRV
jgi:phospholipase/carboxylesterase